VAENIKAFPQMGERVSRI